MFVIDLIDNPCQNVTKVIERKLMGGNHMSINLDMFKTLNEKFSDSSQVDREFWMWLGVRYDTINEYTPERVDLQITQSFKELTLVEMNELLDLVDQSRCDRVETGLTLLKALELESRKRLLLLLEFHNRRKRSITSYYLAKVHDGAKHVTVFNQLLYLYQESPTHLVEIYTRGMWENRGTGDEYRFQGYSLTFKNAKAVISKSFEKRLGDKLYSKSGKRNNYRLLSYQLVDEERILVLFLKQVYDGPLQDFIQPVRNKGVQVLLFELNIVSNTVEMKPSTQFERDGIKESLEETFGVLERNDPRPFVEYDPSKVGAVMRGEADSVEEETLNEPQTGEDEFIVYKVTFAESILHNSPELTLEQKDQDVWAAVRDAHEKECISFESLTDLKNLSVRTGKTKRTIRTRVHDNGNVYLTFDDSRLSPKQREVIEKNFEKRFGFPLFRLIANDHFQFGRADKVDYIMGRSKRKEDAPEDIYTELIENSFLCENKTIRVRCTNQGCSFNALQSIDNWIEECEICESPVEDYVESNLTIDIDTCRKGIYKAFEAIGSCGTWHVRGESTLKIAGRNREFLVLETNEGRVIQVHVTDDMVTKRVVDRIHRMMTPTILVFIGRQSKHLKSYNAECTVSMSFGDVYVRSSEDLNKLVVSLIKTVGLREKNYIASAANKAYSKVYDVLNAPNDVESSYDKEFEQDAFALLKDLFYNTVKWGSEKSGKEFPEGLFTMSFAEKPGDKYKNYAFSYDCKYHFAWSKSKYYSINISEKRKAVTYVRKLNGSIHVPIFCEERQLTGHIFIGNAIKSGTRQTLKDYFERELGRNNRTIPIVLPLDVLAYLHLRYRENYADIQRARNVFMRQLFETFTESTDAIAIKDIDEVINTAIEPGIAEENIIDTVALTRGLERKK